MTATINGLHTQTTTAMTADSVRDKCTDCGLITIGEHLLRRLKEIGCDHLFGVPGDFALAFFNQVLESDVSYVGTCNELNAAYAADAYARCHGVGAFSTTYNVGELSALNGVAGAFAECVPVIAITGVPATTHFKRRPLLHHTLGDYAVPFKIFGHVTAAQVIINNPETVVHQLDAALSTCLADKKPIYIALPADMTVAKIPIPPPFQHPLDAPSDPVALDEAILETLHCLHHSRKPLFIPGVKVMRRGLEQVFASLLAASGIPYATMLLSKCILDEDHPQFIGLYAGDRSRPYVRQRVETADCVIIFGERLTDFNTGGFSALLDRRSTIEVTGTAVRIMCHTYNKVHLHDFVRELTHRIAYRAPERLDIIPAIEGGVFQRHMTFTPEFSRELTMSRFFDRVVSFIKPGGIVLAETGASLFSASEVIMPKGVKFIGQTFYGSIGYTIGATLGACIAAPERDVYLFIGDGSLQVTFPDISTMIRYGCRPTIFVINNDGYTIERVIIDRIYNDIHPWKYHKMTELFGGGRSWDCFTEGDLEAALNSCHKHCDVTRIIEVHLDRWDCNDALRKAGQGMAVVNQLLDAEEMKKLGVKPGDASPDVLLVRHSGDE